MNKKYMLPKIFLAIMILLILTKITLAQTEIPNPIDSEELKKIQEDKEKLEEFATEEDKSEYLSREWTNFLRETGYLNWVYKANPILKFLFGQEFSLSWAFVAAIIIWLGVVSIYYQFSSFLFNKTLTSLAIAILVGAITSNLLTPKILEKVTPLIKTFWNNFLLLLALVILFVILNQISRTIKKIIKKKIERNRIERLEEEVKGTYKEIAEGASAMAKGSKKKT